MAKDYKTASSAIQTIIALYDVQNNLIKTATANATLPATLGEEIEIQPAITLPDDLSNGCYIKTMVWTDINSSLTPYVQSFTFPGGTVDSDWTLDGWEIVRHTETNTDGVKTNEYDALKAVKNGAKASKTFKVEPGSTSLVTFMVKVDDYTTAGATCNVYDKNDTLLGKLEINNDNLSSTTDEYGRLRNYFNYCAVPFNTGANDEVKVEFVNNTNVAVYIDDVSVSDNLIVNGDFNSNTPYSRFAPYWSKVANDNFSRDVSVKVEGDSSLKIEKAASPSYGGLKCKIAKKIINPECICNIVSF